jgi:para-aminobenzoate synthetase component 1
MSLLTNQLRVKSLSIDLSPMEMAAGLAHLGGLVFLDSSSAESYEPTGRHFAVVAAKPTRLLTGNITQSESRKILQNAISENRLEGMDYGFPLGGLVGGVEYGGDFYFGEYPEMLVYDYAADQWFEIGNLSRSCDPDALKNLPEYPFDLSFRGSTDQATFRSKVDRAIEYIASGDIYQVNLTHRFEADWKGDWRDALALYGKLRGVSPAPFSGFFQLGEKNVLSASPEQFLRISGRTIETRPIKGTRPRFRDREMDEKSAYDLITSAKEISELIMITDLERNDLGMICDFGSVQVTELMKLERFAQVFHLISTVEGNLREDVDHVEALWACFPGGSITGAPKKRAREIIAELEDVPRGLYTGTLGCFGFNGESIFNIVIRTVFYEREKIRFHVGAGIVADSDPEAEWEETLHKAAGIFQATSRR